MFFSRSSTSLALKLQSPHRCLPTLPHLVLGPSRIYFNPDVDTLMIGGPFQTYWEPMQLWGAIESTDGNTCGEWSSDREAHSDFKMGIS